MDRPPRKTKIANCFEDKDFDDDEDFVCVKAPPSKKAKEDARHQRKKTSSKSSSQESNSRSSVSQNSRDIDAAITLSLLNDTCVIKEQSPSSKGEDKVRVVVDVNTDPTSVRRVDIKVLGLDGITSETGSPRQKNAATQVTKEQMKKPEDEDEDYEPKLTPALRSPPTTKPAPKRSATSSTVSTLRPVFLSRAGGRIPKWTPPGQIGRSPNSSQSPAVKSPGQGLRLGLSRLVRVKPLHPNVATHRLNQH